jgi:hypothetical protein
LPFIKQRPPFGDQNLLPAIRGDYLFQKEQIVVLEVENELGDSTFWKVFDYFRQLFQQGVA